MTVSETKSSSSCEASTCKPVSFTAYTPSLLLARVHRVLVAVGRRRTKRAGNDSRPLCVVIAVTRQDTERIQGNPCSSSCNRVCAGRNG
ncbi:unnamed protein product [Urochloa humidicola]